MASKVEALVWTVVLNKINTNDLSQIRRPHKAISPNICVMHLSSGDAHNHLFLHCLVE